MNRIKLYRIIKEIKWRDLVMTTGIHNMRLWKIQKGWELPTDEEARRLAEAFGLPSVAALRFTKDKMEISDGEIERLLEL